MHLAENYDMLIIIQVVWSSKWGLNQRFAGGIRAETFMHKECMPPHVYLTPGSTFYSKRLCKPTFNQLRHVDLKVQMFLLDEKYAPPKYKMKLHVNESCTYKYDCVFWLYGRRSVILPVITDKVIIQRLRYDMVTSSNGYIFHVSGPLWG